MNLQRLIIEVRKLADFLQRGGNREEASRWVEGIAEGTGLKRMARWADVGTPIPVTRRNKLTGKWRRDFKVVTPVNSDLQNAYADLDNLFRRVEIKRNSASAKYPQSMLDENALELSTPANRDSVAVELRRIAEVLEENTPRGRSSTPAASTLVTETRAQEFELDDKDACILRALGQARLGLKLTQIEVDSGVGRATCSKRLHRILIPKGFAMLRGERGGFWITDRGREILKSIADRLPPPGMKQQN